MHLFFRFLADRFTHQKIHVSPQPSPNFFNLVGSRFPRPLEMRSWVHGLTLISSHLMGGSTNGNTISLLHSKENYSY